MEDFNISKEKIRISKDGKEIDCDILFTFDSEDTMKAYIGYTDNSIGKNGRKTIYVSAYDPFSNEMKLEDITDPKELEMIHDVLKELDENANSVETDN